MPKSQNVDWSFFRTSQGPRRRRSHQSSYKLGPAWGRGVELLDLEREARLLVSSFNDASRIHSDLRNAAQVSGQCIELFRHYDYRLSIKHSNELFRDHSFLVCVAGPGMPQSLSNPWLERICHVMSQEPIARVTAKSSGMPDDEVHIEVGEPLSFWVRMKSLLSIALLRIFFYSLLGAAALVSFTLVLRLLEIVVLVVVLLFPSELQSLLRAGVSSVLSTASLVGEFLFLASISACALANAFGCAQRWVDREALSAELRIRLLQRARAQVTQSSLLTV